MWEFESSSRVWNVPAQSALLPPMGDGRSRSKRPSAPAPAAVEAAIENEPAGMWNVECWPRNFPPNTSVSIAAVNWNPQESLSIPYLLEINQSQRIHTILDRLFYQRTLKRIIRGRILKNLKESMQFGLEHIVDASISKILKTCQESWKIPKNQCNPRTHHPHSGVWGKHLWKNPQESASSMKPVSTGESLRERRLKRLRGATGRTEETAKHRNTETKWNFSGHHRITGG